MDWSLFFAMCNIVFYPVFVLFFVVNFPLWFNFIFLVWSVFIVYKSIEYVRWYKKPIEV
jgi:hypothetical protein